MPFKPRSVIIAAIAALAFCNAAPAQDAYPTKPIRVIVPFTAGNTADILARVIGEEVGRTLGTTLIVDNRPGAESVLGTALAAAARPDGYTIMLGSTSGLAAAVPLRARLPYDPRDFAPITQITQQSYVLLVKPDFPADTIPELVALAKEQPGRLIFGSSNTTTRVAAELFRSMAGIEMTHVPYTGTDQAVQDLLNEQIALFFAGALTATPHIQRGSLKPLAISTATRSPDLPDLPALGESVPGYAFSAWHALVAPKGTPPEIVARLNEAFRDAMGDAEVLAKLRTAGGTELKSSTPDELGGLIAADIEQWRTIVADAKIPVTP